MPSRHILAVVDPTSDTQPAVQRAVWLAERLEASVELFICDHDQYLAGTRFGDSEEFRAARRRLIDGHLQRLKTLAASHETPGVPISVDAHWHHPLDEGIVKKVRAAKPSLVVKDTHYHPAIERALFSNTDWNLIRKCPCALLLVKPRDISDRPCILAAVDPLHRHDKPADLDRRILTRATDLCAAVEGQLHVFHAYDPAAVVAAETTLMVTPIAAPVEKLTEELELRHRQAFDALLEDHSLPGMQTHLRRGPTHKLLTALAIRLQADIVVMGAVSRRGLERAFIGSTAELVLDHLPCDLLIVKPGDGLSARQDRAPEDPASGVA